ncbi:hypothetical protein PR202_ga07756 [Eleusine coracana subsp. coracana]|uniref:Uncharacterized protein n=1 Tax=Eleusine coracana subsp. coracana TaxID=191504 RepID=A0AAV5C0U4_ELECO|nr:hypothetical protein PR202_ga07756 [Eleusine coracana subsp. coracana]
MAKGSVGGGAGLEGIMRGLKLSEEESSGLKGAWSTKSREDGKVPQAVGKLFASKAGNADGMAPAMGKI